MPLTVSSFGEDTPSGENLEYDSEFTELEIAAQPGEERQRGDEIVAAEEPDYKDIIAKAEAVLARSHDLRAAVYLAHAELRRNGLAGFAGVTGYMRACLTDFWDSCHPQLDAEDDNDPTMRVNAVRGLCDGDTVLRALRLAPMTESAAFGRICLRDLMLLDGEVSPGEEERVPDPAAVSAAFKDTDGDTLTALLTAARQARDDIRSIDDIFNERIPGQGPDMSPLNKMLARIVARLEIEVGVPEPEAEASTEAGAGGAAAASRPAGVGGIGSTRDVINALDRIIDYYAATEPSSPVPIFLRRAKRLVGADFLTIMQDLAPMGMDNVKHIGGVGAAGDVGASGGGSVEAASEDSGSSW